MKPEMILFPIAAMLLLVVVVLILMLKERIAEMKSRRIHPQKVASSTQMARVLENTKAADNYRNLFEMPVLFYVLCLALFITGMASSGFIWAAWFYVALRVIHSLIHIGYNKVMHRLQVFALSATVLALMWLVFVVQLLQR